MNAAIQRSTAFSMLGKTVAGIVYNEQTMMFENIQGMVESVISKGGDVFLKVNGREIAAGRVTIVEDTFNSGEQLNNINNAVVNTQILSLVGKTIQALLIGQDGKVTEFVEGKVDYVKFSGATPILMVGDKEVFPAEVQTVSDGYLLIGSTISAAIHRNVLNADGQMVREQQIITGRVDGVEIDGNIANLLINSGGTVYRVLINRINFATEALQFVGKPVTADGISGIATGVIIRTGTPYVIVSTPNGDREFSLAMIRGDSRETANNDND
jgi:hypothetical protein